MLEQLKQEEKELTAQLNTVKEKIKEQELLDLKVKLGDLLGKYFYKEYGDGYDGEGAYYKILECFPEKDILRVDILTLDRYEEFIYYKQSLIGYKTIANTKEISEKQYNKQVNRFINYQ